MLRKLFLCYNCFRYGHLGKHCCLKCKGNNATDSCTEVTTPKFFHCNVSHYTNATNECLEFKQKEIKN